MIREVTGDLFESGCEALVNAVNCVGVMGGGIALQFKQRYPAMFTDYQQLCQKGKIKPGIPIFWRQDILGRPVTSQWIVNFPTKDDWRYPSQMSYIETGLEELAKGIKHFEIASIAIPALGCGLGGLDWSDVAPRIYRAFATLPTVDVLLYAPGADQLPNLGDLVRIHPKGKGTTSGDSSLFRVTDVYYEGNEKIFLLVRNEPLHHQTADLSANVVHASMNEFDFEKVSI